MPNDLIIYVDFDSTLYDTPRFAKAVWQLISDEAKLPVERVAKEAASFFADSRLGGYDYEGHIQLYGLGAKAMWSSLEALVKKNNYLYEDSPGFIQLLCGVGYKPHILSFGEERFQTIKIKSTLKNLVGSTNHQLGFDIIMRKKREHILEHHPEKRGVLIDDKPDQDLPDGFVEITLNRSLHNETVHRDGFIYLASNLGQVIEVIHSLDRG